MKICQNCGAEVSDTAKFCRKCGSRLEAAPQAAAAQGAAQEEQPQAAAQNAAQGAAMQGAVNEPTVILDEPTYGNQGLREEAGDAFRGSDYQWGPPTGGENYDEPAMPAVFIGEAEEPQQEKEPEREQPYSYQLEAPSYDHTDEFDPKDISDNKVTAMAAYVLGPLGVIIALLAGQDSPYAAFHMRQGLKYVVVEALLAIISLLLCWTIIVPAAAAIFAVIIWVIKIISFISVCRGKAVEPAIIRSMGFLK